MSRGTTLSSITSVWTSSNEIVSYFLCFSPSSNARADAATQELTLTLTWENWHEMHECVNVKAYYLTLTCIAYIFISQAPYAYFEYQSLSRGTWSLFLELTFLKELENVIPQLRFLWARYFHLMEYAKLLCNFSSQLWPSHVCQKSNINQLNIICQQNSQKSVISIENPVESLTQHRVQYTIFLQGNFSMNNNVLIDRISREQRFRTYKHVTIWSLIKQLCTKIEWQMRSI